MMRPSCWQYILDLRVIEKMACSVEERRGLLPLIDRIMGFAERARRDGILAIEAELYADDMPLLLKRGLRLAVDGTDPDRIRKTLYCYSLCGGAKGVDLLRNMVMMEGVLTIQQGCNPRDVKDALLALLGDDFIGETEKYFSDGGEGTRLDKVVVGWLVANATKPAREGLSQLEELFGKMYQQDILTVLREVERDELAVALAGASGRTVSKVLRSVTIRAAKMIIDDIKRHENASDAVVAHAQNRLTELVRQLRKTGEVYLPE